VPVELGPRMTLVSLLLALLVEQLWPLRVSEWIATPFGRLADRLAVRLAGRRLAWLVLMLPAVLLTVALHYFLQDFFLPLAVAFDVGVLYLMMGFQAESRRYAEIHLALRTDDLPRARTLLAAWRGSTHDQAGAGELVRLAMEQALLASHRNVFGIVFWFLVLPGPAGAVLYRFSQLLAVAWSARAGGRSDCGRFAGRMFSLIDWLPARLTAASFSVVGNFEDALYCWRTQANQWSERSSGILISSGAGAMGLRLGLPVHESGRIVERPEMGTGNEARPEDMQSAVRLVIKALLLCLMLLSLVVLAAWVGG